MSLMPTKKSDMNKPWLKRRDDRAKKIRINPEYHLIITEGTDTEPKYFEAIKNEINKNYRDRISLEIEGVGDNTLNLFFKAKEKAEKSPNGYKHVWLVYDTDDFPAEHINLTADLCNEHSSEQTEYHALWSNQCIELWFLLHFDFYQSDIHRSEYWPKLTDYLTKMGAGEYKKNRDDMYELLEPNIEHALRNAKKLKRSNSGKTPTDSAPGTMVYLIIEKLMPYLEIKNNRPSSI